VLSLATAGWQLRPWTRRRRDWSRWSRCGPNLYVALAIAELRIVGALISKHLHVFGGSGVDLSVAHATNALEACTGQVLVTS
jgi:hypothetical protein